MAIKDSTGVLQQVDAQVRRVNTILRQAAETFGTNSIQYRQRYEQVMAGLDQSNVTTVNGVTQIRRNRTTLESIRDRGYQKRAMDRVEGQASIKEERQKMLHAYMERTQGELQEQIRQAKEAGQDVSGLQELLKQASPGYVSPDIKGRAARAQARKAQTEAAIKEQAAYYASIDKALKSALDLLYDLESDMGEYTQAHMDINRISRGMWTNTEDKMKMLEIVNSELAASDHQIATDFESGLSGTILGIGSGGL